MSDELRFATILVPTDFSPTAERALELASVLARAAGPAHLILVHAHFVPLEIEALAVRVVAKVYAEIEAQASAQLQKACAKLDSEGVKAEYVALEGATESVIVKLAGDRHADLIVTGTHGRKGLGHLFLGSVAERVLRTAPCPVITVPPE